MKKTQISSVSGREKELPSVGLVLDGGVARGPFQLGVLFALHKFGLDKKICGVSGASIGGFMAVLSCYKNPLDAYNIWKKIDQSLIMPVKEKKIKALKDTLFHKQGFFSREQLSAFIQSNLNLGKLVNSVSYPIYLSLAKLNEGEKEKDRSYTAIYQKINGLSSESILHYLLATSAIPYVFDPVNIDNNIYVDPMKADNEPVQPLLEACPEMDMVFIVPLNSSHYKHYYPSSFPYPIVDFAVSEMMDQPKLNMLDFDKEHLDYYVSLGYQTAKLLLSYLDNNNFLVPFSKEMQLKKQKPYYSLQSMGISSLTFAKMSVAEIIKDSLRRKG